MCQHLHQATTEYERTYTGDGGLEFEITSLTYCLDCGEEVDLPAIEVLARDAEPTVYEIENQLVPF